MTRGTLLLTLNQQWASKMIQISTHH